MPDRLIVDATRVSKEWGEDLGRELEAAGFEVEVRAPQRTGFKKTAGLVFLVEITAAASGAVVSMGTIVAAVVKWARAHGLKGHPSATLQRLAKVYGPDGEVLAEVPMPSDDADDNSNGT